MPRKAYLSIEGNYVKALVIKKTVDDAKFYEFSLEQILDFIEENSIKELYLSAFFSELYTFKFSLSSKISEKKKILERLIFNEIRKRYPDIQNFSFIYESYISQTSSYIRCYMVPEDSYRFIEDLIEANVNIKALYPIHIPLMVILNSISDLVDKNKIVCFLSGKTRFLFVFERSEMILMREYEGSEDINDEDIANINMTINYAIQTLRVNPQQVILIGTKNIETARLNLPYRVISLFPENDKYAIPYGMVLYEGDLKNQNILPQQYIRFKKTIKYLSYASFIFILSTLFLFGYTLNSFYKVKSLYSSVMTQKQNIIKHESEFFNISKKIKEFEMELKPLIELQNQRNSLIDTRYIIKGIGESKEESIEIDSIEIRNEGKTSVKIKAKIAGKNFSEKQISYLSFKDSLNREGFKISSENWELTKGELSIDGVYEHKKVLQ
ncbi:MAG: hypothetical protein RMI30_04065 [Thermodesulfovibrio sp.]|nr:hypothetical protein [Thermodesulfovibrio sp.]MDW7998611.1 hypothetical protein [Thermodesulfovibrio sp.]